jgi:SAM-dependent methyltransferase
VTEPSTPSAPSAPSVPAAAPSASREAPGTPGVFTHSADLYDTIYGFKDYAAEAQRVHEVIEARRRPGAPATLLDVACGTGKHLEQLARWYGVEGLDLDPNLLAVAAGRLPGVSLHAGDMTGFDLGRTFGAVVTLFSSIGYVKTEARLRRAVARLAAHLAPGGVLVVEPWFLPGAYVTGRPHALFIDRPDLKLVRMNASAVEGQLSVLEFHYLLATADGVSHFSERHELALFSAAQYAGAFAAAGLEVEHDPQGLTGRGLFVGTWPDGASSPTALDADT